MSGASLMARSISGCLAVAAINLCAKQGLGLPAGFLPKLFLGSQRCAWKKAPEEVMTVAKDVSGRSCSSQMHAIAATRALDKKGA